MTDLNQHEKNSMANKTPSNRWKAGQSGNPAGRPPGQSEITKLRAMLMPQAPELLEIIFNAAKGGDMVAARLILERILPAVKPIELGQEISVNSSTLTGKAEAILNAVFLGQIAPTQGSHFLSALAGISRVAEFDEIERRISALERTYEKQN